MVTRSAHERTRRATARPDARTLTAYDLEGRRLWQYPLGEPCLGRPLIVRGRVYLPTLDGKVHEVNLNDGKCRGRNRTL